MKEITIAPGVKIVFEEDCDSCKSNKEETQRYIEISSKLRYLIQRVKDMCPKVENNTWDKGYNHCLQLVQRIIDDDLI